jgi:cobalt-zinc-cadmium efflux system protein
MSSGHVHAPGRDRRALACALAITAGYLVVEAIGGVVTNSLALLSDAAHMFTDVIALSLGLFAVWIAGRPATESKTYGYYRAEILVALVNGIALWLVVILILWEAWQRILDPPPVRELGVLGVATVGLVVNLISARLLAHGDLRSLNMRGALLHVVSDLLGSLGVVISGVVILVTGWTPADAVASIAIGMLILFSTWNLIREAVDILMEAVPRHIDIEQVRQTLAEVPGAGEVHDLHVWSLTTGRYALSAHAVLIEGCVPHTVLCEMTARLAERFGIEHVTIQLESESRLHVEPGH